MDALNQFPYRFYSIPPSFIRDVAGPAPNHPCSKANYIIKGDSSQKLKYELNEKFV